MSLRVDKDTTSGRGRGHRGVSPERIKTVIREFGESSGCVFHQTKHMQKGGQSIYVYEFLRREELEVTIPHTRKRGFHHKCPVRVVFSNNTQDHVWRVCEGSSIFDHHADCRAFTTRSRVTSTQIRNLPVVQSMTRNHPDMTTPSFVQAVMDVVGASCHQSHLHMCRTLTTMRQPRSLMDSW